MISIQQQMPRACLQNPKPQAPECARPRAPQLSHSKPAENFEQSSLQRALLWPGTATLRMLKTGFRLAALFALAMLMTGCDPTINFYGTFVPAWLICMAAGATGAVLLRYLFAALKLEQHLGPLILVYPCLVLLLSCVVWILFFQS
jgi:hypothetical protein